MAMMAHQTCGIVLRPKSLLRISKIGHRCLIVIPWSSFPDHSLIAIP
jgi:hypothetical protein